jgi:hypothetical protein
MAVEGVSQGAAVKMPPRPELRALYAPSDLLAWVAATDAHEAARVLAVDGGRIRQLRRGDSLRISPALLARWEAHKAQVRATPWQLRRVGQGGVVMLAGTRWHLPALLVRQRDQVLVSLSTHGALLVRLADGPVMVSIEPGCAA